MPTTKQHRHYRQLISELGISEDDRRAMIEEVSNGRTRSSKDMTQTEMQSMIDGMRQYQTDNATPAVKRQRRKAIGLAAKINFLRKGNQADLGKLNRFCKNKTKAKKRLYDMSESELNKLVTQLEIIHAGEAQKEYNALQNEALNKHQDNP